MTEREKVIKGLKHCIGDNCSGDKWYECEYSGHGCIDALLEDALALLKAQDKDAEIIRKCQDGKVLKHVGDGVVVLNFEWWRKMVSKCDHIKIVPSVEELLKAQEPRVMTLEEVKALCESTPVWIEDVDKRHIIGGLFVKDYTGTQCFDYVIVRDWNFDIITVNYSDYGVRWRCWTSRPDQATREAVPWN